MKKYTPHIGYGDILDRCAQPGCPICRLGREAAATYLKMVLYECVTDPDIREHLHTTLGYCQTHAWLLSKLEKGNILGIAIIYEGLIGNLRQHIGRQATRTTHPGLFQRLWARVKRLDAQSTVPIHQQCPACEVNQGAETLSLAVVVRALTQDDDQMLAALRKSEGLCLRHLRQALTNNPDVNVQATLLRLAETQLTQIQTALQELIRKYDHRFQHEPVGAERESWKWAMRFIVGGE